MRLFRLKGGVNPPHHKSVTENRAMEVMPAPQKVILSLASHLGAPAIPLVKPGDSVKTGEKIAEAAGHLSAPLHASITGMVTGLGAFPDARGYSGKSIVIENSGQPEVIQECRPMDSPFSADTETLLRVIKEAGVVGLGGAAFPTHVKLDPPKQKIIDTLIINGCECEPWLSADNRLMVESSEQIIDGIRLLKKILGVHNVLVGIEDNKPDAFEIMRHAADIDSEITVSQVPTIYPQGGEKQLIKVLTGREVPPPPGLPLDSGIVVQNVATCVAVFEAVVLGKPCYERLITVSGDAIMQPRNLLVRNGTTAEAVLAYCGGPASPVKKIILGGPMMGLAAAEPGVPLAKAMSGVLFLSGKEALAFEPQTCIRCGSCVKACTLSLLPCDIAAHANAGRIDRFRDQNGLECCECGACAYACPARIPLVQHIRIGKKEAHVRAR